MLFAEDVNKLDKLLKEVQNYFVLQDIFDKKCKTKRDHIITLNAKANKF